jgi:four helix bundle protein
MFNFEKLDVWQGAIRFAELVYSLTAKFPPEECYGLSNQMQRASVSVSSNIAEGCSRSSCVEYARYVEIATGSVFETVSESAVARTRHYVTESEHRQLYDAAERLSRMLSGLRKSLLREA